MCSQRYAELPCLGEFCFPKNKTMTFNSEFLQGLDEITTEKSRMAAHVNYFRNSKRAQIKHLPSQKKTAVLPPPSLLAAPRPLICFLSPCFLDWRSHIFCVSLKKKKMHKGDFCKANCIFPEAYGILAGLLWPSQGIDLWLAAYLLTL